MSNLKATLPVRRPRLADVASAAGVSTMTVVRVLREPAKVALATRARVEQVIRDIGYVPDRIARGLASNRSGMIAAVIPVLTNSLIAEIMQGLTDTVVPQGFHLLLGASGFSSPEEESLVRAFLSRRVDAIYLSGVGHTAETVKMLQRAGIPVVEGGNLTDDPIDMVVGFSNVAASRAITHCPPAFRTMATAAVAVAWKTGVATRTTERSEISRMSAIAKLAAIASTLCITPFGTPVVPEV